MTLHCNIDNNLDTEAIFLNFTKALDWVPYKRPPLKLSHLNPAVFHWNKKFLNNHSQSVLVNDQLSSYIPITSGFCNWYVVIFNINHRPTSELPVLTDDCVLYHAVNNVYDQISLQCDLNQVQCWCEHWKVELNPNECKLMFFHRCHSPPTTSYKISNTLVELVHSYKCLGVTLCCDLAWTEHMQTISILLVS